MLRVISLFCIRQVRVQRAIEIVIIPAATLTGALVGFLVGLPSRRLSGDYLAIVTLFFLELFETVATNGNQIFGHNVTGGSA